MIDRSHRSVTTMTAHQFTYDLRALLRNRQAQFFTLALPVLFLVIFASIFGGHGHTVRVAGGRIDTIDPDRSRTDRARRYWLRAGVTDRVRVINEPALRVLPRLAPGIEFAFIDAIKTEYLAYLDALLPKMAPGGMITVDNVLWSGRVAAGVHDEDTDALRAFNERFLRHEQLEATVVPVGDGLGIGVVRPHA